MEGPKVPHRQQWTSCLALYNDLLKAVVDQYPIFLTGMYTWGLTTVGVPAAE